MYRFGAASLNLQRRNAALTATLLLKHRGNGVNLSRKRFRKKFFSQRVVGH